MDHVWPSAYIGLIVSGLALVQPSQGFGDLAPIKPKFAYDKPWEATVTLPWGVGPEVVLAGRGNVLVASGSEVAALDPKDGHERWRARADWIVPEPNVQPLPWYRPMDACETKSCLFIEFASVKNRGLVCLDPSTGRKLVDQPLAWTGKPYCDGARVVFPTDSGFTIYSGDGALLAELQGTDRQIRPKFLRWVPSIRGKQVRIGGSVWSDGWPVKLPGLDSFWPTEPPPVVVQDGRIFATCGGIESILRPIEGLEYNPTPGGPIGIANFGIKVDGKGPYAKDAWGGKLIRGYDFNKYGQSCFGPVCAVDGKQCFAYFLKSDGGGDGVLYLSEFAQDRPTIKPELVVELNRRLPSWHIYDCLPQGSKPLFGHSFLFKESGVLKAVDLRTKKVRVLAKDVPSWQVSEFGVYSWKMIGDNTERKVYLSFFPAASLVERS